MIGHESVRIIKFYLLLWLVVIAGEAALFYFEAQRNKAALDKAESAFISCLNGGAVMIGGELFSCRMINTGLAASDF